MTNTQTLLEISKALKAQLWSSLEGDPQTNTIITIQDQITFSTPKAAAAGKKKLAVFLYCITPDIANKNLPSSGEVGGREAKQIDCSMRYLITPCTGNAENDLLLLGNIIQVLSSYPILVANAAERGSYQLTMMLDSLSLNDLSKLWTAIGEPLEPSLSLTVSPVSYGVVPMEQTALTPAPALSNSTQIMELYKVVFDTFEQQINDWKNRNLFQKQYVQSDFAKNTGMTVDAMRSELRALGEKLEMNRPIEPHMEALRSLEEFYEHQLNMLKGFEKMQKKRQEGIDLVIKWKNDVTALIEALNP